MSMTVEYLHISAFTSTPGQGNSAAVCEFDAWPSDEELSRLARTIGLPVTACVVPTDGALELRWLSKAGLYVQSMCGHGTLAAACAMALKFPQRPAFEFSTPGGSVAVWREGEVFHLALPRWDSVQLDEVPAELSEALGRAPVEVWKSVRDTIAVYASESDVRALSPDMKKLLTLGRQGFIATARGDGFDCVSRFFCPAFGLGVDEDPVTGSAHCAIAPLWARKLGKSRVHAFQASPQGGELICEVGESTVTIGSTATLCERCVVDFPSLP